MESSEQTDLTSKIESGSETQADSSGRGISKEGLSKKEKGLTDMDNI